MDIITNTKKQINNFLNFEENWDGYNSNRFSAHTVDYVLKVLDVINEYYKNTSDIYISPCPCSDGSIDLEILIKGKILSIGVSQDTKTIDAYFENINGEWEEKIINESEFDLKMWLDKIGN